MSDELKPCPFCNGECDATGWLRGDGARGPECEGCGATAASVEVWNRRAQPAGAEGVEAQLRRVIDELKAGFVVCQQCGDQEDTATLDCVPELEAIAAAVTAVTAVTAERDRLQKKWARVESERDKLRAEVDGLRARLVDQMLRGAPQNRERAGARGDDNAN